ncbi:GntR family transcriptional regulator [Fimbriimonas ginsengisoli]|uniref:Regulatory protein, LacI:Periplasmic binding protein/LacI transcriptional regulator n=1 Tax=Fimbriimonas ginsengisoli Gsoil 348 TaxID=661478 RepID=A0A068NQH1_FIMGI|nr:GntR family transcriptional regulator [Fimbriimonas ginsengisoli]AIE85813.1 regulatory protein, LacI:Periplasmic binding protein/LacI transcriptional regulator [Fimbriimonas ginsengisoli Gsoil 348]
MHESPLVMAVIDGLRDRIRRGDLPVGRGLPGERDLAKTFHVSRVIVRSAIRKLEAEGLLLCKPNCRPIVRNPGIRTANETAEAGALRRAEGHGDIAIWLWPNAGDYCASSILKGIQSADLPRDIRLVVANVPSGRDWEGCLEAEERYLLELAEDPHAIGTILWYLGTERNRHALEKVRAAGIPMVFVDRLPPKGFEADFVGSDNEAAARQSVKHLADLGHRRIALITNNDAVSSVLAREAGYRRALNDARIPFDPELVFQDMVDEPEGVEAALDELLSLPEPPTAIVGINDHVALQVHAALQSRGISVPGDISLLGFDGLLRWVPGGGFLTTCCQSFERIGQLATELLCERSKASFGGTFRHVLLDAPLMIAGSTAEPRSISVLVDTP